ncbi:MAG: nickel-dependent lactate racemase [Clostridia bacterium]|nr:nickel-dependent lactate racemase [Clostridia bacterium]
MKLDFGYGKGIQSVHVAEKHVLKQLLPLCTETTVSEHDEIERALSEPLGCPVIERLFKPGEKVAVVISDITRPMPSYKVLISIIDRLNKAGIPDNDITVVSALGSHRHQTQEELVRLAGEECYKRVRVVDSDPDDCIRFGVTSRGTPVDITRIVAKADRRICVGNVEFHYFAGFSGGYKAIMPGCSTPGAIQSNHRLMTEAGAYAGNIDTNPLREDIDEAGRMTGVDFILNVVLDEHKKIVKAFAGDPVIAHREACDHLRKMFGVPIEKRADIVICSQGGAPKDLNLYQTQKALDNAKHAVKDGGVIILVGACQEGLGGSVFENWMRSAASPDELISRIRENFVLGGHKAAAIAMVLKKAEIFMVSEMDPKLVKSIFLKPYSTLSGAYRAAQKKFGGRGTVITMPYGGSTLPITE